MSSITFYHTRTVAVDMHPASLSRHFRIIPLTLIRPAADSPNDNHSTLIPTFLANRGIRIFCLSACSHLRRQYSFFFFNTLTLAGRFRHINTCFYSNLKPAVLLLQCFAFWILHKPRILRFGRCDGASATVLTLCREEAGV